MIDSILTVLITILLTTVTVKVINSYSDNKSNKKEIFIKYKDIDKYSYLIDGVNLVTVEFPSDTIHLIPVGDSYVLYSYLEEDPFPIDMLYTNDAQSFIWWLSQYPLEPTDHNLENPTEYYRELLLEKIYE